jgi:hypothetical protein
MMKATVLLKGLLLGSFALLTACGGGGSGDDGGFGPIQSARISASATSSSVPAGGTLAVSVVVSNSNNTPIADGTAVTASASPSNLGGVFGVVNGQTTSSNSATTVGGRAEFIFVTTESQGAVTLTFSTQPVGQPAAVSTSVPVTVTAPAANGSISIQATRTQLPVNLFGIRPFFGSPYMSEFTITARTASGQAISIPRGDAGGLGITINPVTVAAFSTLDDPETEDDPATPEIENNEFLSLLGQGPVNIVAGRATIFVHSFNVPGTATIVASIQDPETGRTMTTSQVITIVTSAPALPASVSVSPTFAALYVNSSGGASSGAVEIDVSDSIGQPVPDPVAGNIAFNNVRVEVVGDGAVAAGERVTGVNAAGQTVTGQQIALRTTNGVVNATFIAGTRVGPTTIRATADRADNNVDNGITDPVVAERTIIVSDGRLFSVQLTAPYTAAVQANRTVDATSGIRNNGDGTYSIVVSALATDRQGNPVLPGTVLEFGLVDSPASGFPNVGSGVFTISGGDGNPQENGFLFSSPTGAFQTAGGGAGPGDTLLVFGQSVPGNRDLESARSIQQVNSQGALTVTQRFNRNDDTGVIVDAGNALPYVIGRAVHGNIARTAQTNARGVASTQLTFPVSRLGQAVAVWVRGSETTSVGQELITDIETYVYPGAGPVTITASPTSLQGNATVPVRVCAYDGFGNPIPAANFNFGFALRNGSGQIGGQLESGQVASPTGADGCVSVSVTTSGLVDDSSSPSTLEFALGASDPVSVDIIADEFVILEATPQTVFGNGLIDVQLKLNDSSGNPIAGTDITGVCAGSGETAVVEIIQQPAPTDANGRTLARMQASLMDQPGGGATWRCVFSEADGEPVAVVTILGRDSCAGEGFSPPPPAGTCDDAGGGDPSILNLSLNANGVPGATVTTDDGVTCGVAAGGTQTCQLEIADTAPVTLLVTHATPRNAPSISGSCQFAPAAQPSPALTFTLTTGTLQPVNTCSLVFQ